MGLKLKFQNFPLSSRCLMISLNFFVKLKNEGFNFCPDSVNYVFTIFILYEKKFCFTLKIHLFIFHIFFIPIILYYNLTIMVLKVGYTT